MPLQGLSHPLVILFLCVATFLPLRLALGGGNYLPSRPWYLLCLIIPGYVVLGVAVGAFCVPASLDAVVIAHIGVALLYTQLDLCVARRLVGSGFGSWSLPALLWDKMSVNPHHEVPDGIVVPGIVPLARSCFELNGALMHEIFWNVFICQNCIFWGAPAPLAILAVPASSCLVHAITSNINQGIRCLPNFMWVALAFHASGSVLVPGFIHALWYFTDAKMCFALKTMKREWDVGQRAGEVSTPPWDSSCTIGLVLVLCVYVPLSALAWRSEAGWDYLDSCSYVQPPGRSVEWALCIAGTLQVVMGFATWGPVRAGMDVLEETGDLSEKGVQAVQDAVQSYAGGGAFGNRDHDGL